MTRVWASVVLVAALASMLLSGCTEKAQYRDVLLAIIAHTEQVAREYQYSEVALGHRTVVTGAIADDLRYTAHVSLDGRDAADEIVKDDSRALRITNAGLLQKALQSPTTGAKAPKSAAPGAGPSPSPGAATIASAPLGISAAPLPGGAGALRQGQWVVDPTGASLLTQTAGLKIQLGGDPVLDALTVLRYVALEENASKDVTLFNPEAIDYKAYEDPFPWPDKSAGEVRYDLVPVDLIPRDSIGAGRSQHIQALPQADYFRHLAVYVRGGLVVTVRESISAIWRLNDSSQDLLPRLSELGVHISASLPIARKAQAVITALSQLETGIAEDPIRAREMVLSLSSFGSKPDVTLPSGGVMASLNGIYERGQVLNQNASLGEGT